jgi:TolB-like protein
VENSQDNKTSPEKNKRQTIAVVVVLTVFVLGGLLAINWRSIFPADSGAHSIALIPLENPRQDGYSANIAENLTASLFSNLTRVSAFPVVPMSEVMRYRGKNQDPQSLGKVLKAKAIVTGSVLREGDNVTVKVQLIDVKTGSQVWSNQYNAAPDEVNKVPEDIARQVTAAAGNIK